MVYAGALRAPERKFMRVRVPPSAQSGNVLENTDNLALIEAV
jgi:hypothetical protein